MNNIKNNELIEYFNLFCNVMIENYYENNNIQLKKKKLNILINEMNNNLYSQKNNLIKNKPTNIVKSNSININNDFNYLLKTIKYCNINNTLKELLSSNYIERTHSIIKIENIIIKSYDYNYLINIVDIIIFNVILNIFIEYYNDINYIYQVIESIIMNKSYCNNITIDKLKDYISDIINNEKEININNLLKDNYYNIFIFIGVEIIKEYASKNSYIKIKYNDILEFLVNNYLDNKKYNNINDLILLFRQVIECIYLFFDLFNISYYIKKIDATNLKVKSIVVNKHLNQKYYNGIMIIYEENSFNIILPIDKLIIEPKVISNKLNYDIKQNSKENNNISVNIQNKLYDFLTLVKSNDNIIKESLNKDFENLIKNNSDTDNKYNLNNYEYKFQNRKYNNIDFNNKNYKYNYSLNNNYYDSNRTYNLDYKTDLNKYNYHNYSNNIGNKYYKFN